jgi:polysaccharide export outer membrane protein
MNLTTHVVAGALALNLGFGLQARTQSADAAQKAGSPAAEAKTSSIPGNDNDYKIGPQDVLRIDVWKEAEISRTTPVRPDGKISLPLLDDVQAAGLTPVQLAGVIAEGLKKYITNPQVTVGVAEINSRRIYVTGEVTRPGAFPLLPDMTILQALSTSGGFTQFARLKSIYVLRTEDGKQVKHPFDYKAAVAGKKAEQNLLLHTGDVIVVP